MRHAVGHALLVALLLVGPGIVYLGSAPAHAGNTVKLCHFPPGNPDNFHTITVGADAADAHIENHGDVLGECCAIDSVCDDGDACTANFCLDNACSSEPVDCDDGNPCTNEVGCDPDGGCINEPVACDEGEACNTDTGVCLPVGQCPCWLGSNPIDKLKATFASVNPFDCVEPMDLTCNGDSMALAGAFSGPNGAAASFSVSMPKPGNPNSCPIVSGGDGSGTCSCPPPPDACFGMASVGTVIAKFFPEATTCIEEFEAACAAVQ
jgi:hypothetical protein